MKKIKYSLLAFVFMLSLFSVSNSFATNSDIKENTQVLVKKKKKKKKKKSKGQPEPAAKPKKKTEFQEAMDLMGPKERSCERGNGKKAPKKKKKK